MAPYQALLSSLLALSATLVSVSASASYSQQEGCYNTAGSLSSQGTYRYQSQTYCLLVCQKQGRKIAAVKEDECFCGDELPPADAKVDGKECNTPCSGWPQDICGGPNTWTVISHKDIIDTWPPSSSTSVASSLDRTALGTAITVAPDVPPPTGIPITFDTSINTNAPGTRTASGVVIATANPTPSAKANNEAASNSPSSSYSSSLSSSAATPSTSDSAAGSVLRAGRPASMLVAAVLIPFVYLYN
ncbi:hypothetical protein VTN00DRAFT_7230 [Thermoascus crustaceus]|uniref:uncharacterized protein n=1 Tax=Thermoascus crustaceus TaxID=5088 RepID=UPI0037438966